MGVPYILFEKETTIYNPISARNTLTVEVFRLLFFKPKNAEIAIVSTRIENNKYGVSVGIIAEKSRQAIEKTTVSVT